MQDRRQLLALALAARRGERRGTMRFRVTPQRAQVMAVDDARNPASAMGTLARFGVEAGRPGPQAA